jgi:hypothetical protein
MVEEKLINIALSLDEPMSSGRLVVDEAMNCTGWISARALSDVTLTFSRQVE